MKSMSIVAIALLALVAACSGVPVVNQPVATDARIDIYNDFLAGLFSGLVQTTFGSVSNFLNQLITDNPLGIGKRDVTTDVQARIDALTFLYDNILQGFFSGIVSNTFNTLSNTLLNLIQTNPLGVGKRDVEGDLAARVDALSFLYDNILQGFFSGLVSNTFNLVSTTLLDLIQTNPLGVGKRDVQGDLAARVDALSFLYDNILQGFFSGLVSNTFNLVSTTLLDLIQTNPLGVGKRSVNIQEIQVFLAQAVSVLVAKFKTFGQQVLASWNDRQKLNELIKDNVTAIKATIAHLANELSQLIPAAISTQVAEVLAAVQSVLVYYTSGIAGSLGPVLGPFRL